MHGTRPSTASLPPVLIWSPWVMWPARPALPRTASTSTTMECPSAAPCWSPSTAMCGQTPSPERCGITPLASGSAVIVATLLPSYATSQVGKSSAIRALPLAATTRCRSTTAVVRTGSTSTVICGFSGIRRDGSISPPSKTCRTPRNNQFSTQGCGRRRRYMRFPAIPICAIRAHREANTLATHWVAPSMTSPTSPVIPPMKRAQ